VTAETERFIRVYEDLVRQVNKSAGMSESHSLQIDKAAQNDGGVSRHQDVLHYIRKIRNALQHPKHRTTGHAMTVSPDFLTEVEGILNYLRNPPNARSVGISRKDMKTAKLTDPLGDLADDMKLTGFSHLPILNDQDVLIGVFNEAAVFDFLWRETEQIVSRSMTVGDILPHCRLDAQHTETFKFVPPSISVDTLTDRFRAIETPLTRVGAIFVTPSGKAEEPVHRLITPWDVIAHETKQ
jgi:CBS domain-containing protein